MPVHHHGRAVAYQNSVNGGLREQTGEGVVIAGYHRELAARGLCVEKVLCGHRLGTCRKKIKSRTYMLPRGIVNFESLRWPSALFKLYQQVWPRQRTVWLATPRSG